ncbi:two-component regulator propeller domain-containing protein [Draconibacterium sp. IB214405]|uniref:hybrid sensor histidine kinase/response regulator transcription factor n=1 Tax=Draconibacterium sp. IB214405 TaxID=3097352 RepID=UPI002A136950|nr:two-component regulator propeller domain-containing protein [Draconibacterium sp. IB214405]MDX8338932.1 two-component regulator propeller domain-containing protein [Draconibacterium sp. IB214405]
MAQAELSFDIFTPEDGLPNNQIQCIYQDHKGWIWVGTSQGLSRFNGYDFTNFLPNSEDSCSLSGHLIRVIKEDKKGNLLVGTENGGVNIFNREKEVFTQPYKNDPVYGDKDFSVNDIIENQDGSFWLASDFNVLKMDSTGMITPLNPILKEGTARIENTFIRNLAYDKQGRLWIGSNNGVYIYTEQNNTLERFELPFGAAQNKEIWELLPDNDGDLWVGTYSIGLFVVNTANKSYKQINLRPAAERTETIKAISKGVFGDYWIGTRGGLFLYSKETGVKGFYRHNIQEPRSLSNNSVLSIFHDNKGETWIGTRGGLNLLAKSKQVFHSFTAQPDDNRYLNSSAIYTFWMDKTDRLWCGTEDGGINIYNPKTGTYSYLTTDGTSGYTIAQNCVKALIPDNNGNLWVGTYLGGIDVIDLSTGRIKNYSHKADVPGSLSDNRVWDICIDENQQIWIASSKGIDRFDKETNLFIHYPQLNGDEQIMWIENDSQGNLWMGSDDELIVFNYRTNKINRWFERTRYMFEDSQNQIWIATNDKGLALYSADSGAERYYGEEDGLANNQALCILEDNSKNLWISTLNGLSKFNPNTGVFYNYTSKDGLGDNQFCYGAALKAVDGALFFGNVSGFNVFNPNEISVENPDIPLVFTDLKVFNKSVPIGSDKKSILHQSITETHHLTFNHKQNVFTLEFAALNYVNSANNLYTYKLEGFNTDWIEPSKNRTATYTNLNPGDYTLRIKRVLPGQEQETNELQLAITVLPPFWKTNWFLGIIILLIISLIYTIIQFFINREKIKSQLIIERSNAKKLHEIDMMKLKFFTNISHEIRTPLTLILGPLNKMMQSKTVDGLTKENLELMQRNAQNLDRLISQLLDFRKLQSGNLRLNLTEADIVSFVRNIVNSFGQYAVEKDIKLSFNSLKKRLFVAFDPDKVEKIINNLLTNAFKYTEAHGSITVNLSLVFDSENVDFSDDSEEKQFIEINIKDTGKGISRKNIDRIFMRFFQSDDTDAKTGAGIGLALVKDLVKLHKGEIFVTSKEGKGTRFTIRIPYNERIESAQETEPATAVEQIQSMPQQTLQPVDEHSKIMLIVEDNADVRQFISSHFINFYQIHQAVNGEEGWQKALDVVPDIIVSDIIMPEMDGYELCKRIKNDERTSHIPVLLLTAMHSKDHELRGLAKGADDYITKPFDLSVLQAKVENMLSIRDSLKEKYTSTMVLEPTNVVLASPDEKFLKRVVDVIEENIADSELDIEQFALKVGVSRMQLYRKLNALTNMTVKEFIRHIRLKRATQLLDQQKLNISEIAYQVGFKDLSHFRKCFKREFGMSASEYLANKKVETVNIKQP